MSTAPFPSNVDATRRPQAVGHPVEATTLGFADVEPPKTFGRGLAGPPVRVGWLEQEGCGHWVALRSEVAQGWGGSASAKARRPTPTTDDDGRATQLDG